MTEHPTGPTDPGTPEAPRDGSGAPEAADPTPAGGPPRPPRSARRMFCATVLACQAFVVFFATLAAYGMRTASGPVLLAVGIGGALVCFLAAGMLRGVAGYVAGSAIQVAFLLAGALVADLRVHLLAVAVTFALLWVVSLVVGRRIDVERAERYQGELDYWADRGARDAGR
ncbi:uncharacterized protein DUF4233 [Salana multivorans]|uniref:Uncharacterized protein DUF4233 n=1 Tax=Salana multivorans TaxID=120377 RepID=A0A3N2D2F7_9MICO|nr:DUF4233 domain-containing protein [Salana multivorans]MBN8882843.1 DUF4233 domain-containing protein [Salana multivorans]ROR93955.1 uncharacterized protein DUF4233 [Salana multivorans]